MKNLNRILMTAAVCYSFFTALVFYQIFREGIPFYGGKWKLVWRDEFEGSALDLGKWTAFSEGGSVNDELQAYVDENVTIRGGLLTITSRKQDWTGPGNFHPGQAVTRHFTSGRVETKGKYTWAYGRFEIKARFPRGRGLLSQVSLYSAESWPPQIVIVECKGRAAHEINMLNFWKLENRYLLCDTPGPVAGPDYSEGFHIFTVEWEPRTIRWYIDGVQQYQIYDYHVPDKPLFLSLSTNIGGVYGGEPDDSVLPKRYEVDWVRVYQRK